MTMSSKLPEKRSFSPTFAVDSTNETTSLIQTSSTDSSYATSPTKNAFIVDNLEYSAEEESIVLRILDRRLMPCILVTTFVLNMDRTNNSNAISDNLPADLGFGINVVNTATAMYSVLFAVTCLSGAVLAKIVGPARCDFHSCLTHPHILI